MRALVAPWPGAHTLLGRTKLVLRRVEPVELPVARIADNLKIGVIEANKYDLSINRYKLVVHPERKHDAPQDLVLRLAAPLPPAG